MPLWDAKGENLNSFTKEVAKISPKAASLPARPGGRVGTTVRENTCSSPSPLQPISCGRPPRGYIRLQEETSPLKVMSALFSDQEMCKNNHHLSEPGVSQLFTGFHPFPFQKPGGCHVLQVDYRKHVAVNLATSHPHYDDAGNVLNIGTSIVDKGKTKYVIFKIPATVSGGSFWGCNGVQTPRVALSEEF